MYSGELATRSLLQPGCTQQRERSETGRWGKTAWAGHHGPRALGSSWRGLSGWQGLFCYNLSLCTFLYYSTKL